ncbi:MAG: hypothetical protein GY859_40225 [Desulfobacterales bacterium]|nr:hypothetical protein [Desulfobacterales bacterium]
MSIPEDLRRATRCLFQQADEREMALVAWTTVHGFANLAVKGRIRGKGCARGLEDLADNSQIHTVEARLKKEFVCGNLGLVPTSLIDAW